MNRIAKSHYPLRFMGIFTGWGEAGREHSLEALEVEHCPSRGIHFDPPASQFLKGIAHWNGGFRILAGGIELLRQPRFVPAICI